MIRELQLENFLFMEKANLSFSSGLNVITGETGAGKSVMLEAVKLILGKKARSNVVLQGENTAKIQAEFNIKGLSTLKKKLEEYGLENEDDEDTLCISRTFREEGNGKVFVNGIMTTATTLKEVGPYLIEIHGQNEHQTLLSPEVQRQLLDRTGSDEHKNNLENLKEAYKVKQQLMQQLSELENKGKKSAERIEELQDILQDLMKLNLDDVNEEENLKEELKILSHSEQILTNLQIAVTVLSGCDDAEGAVSSLYKAYEALRKISDYDSELSSFSAKIESIYYELQSIQRDLEAKAEDTNMNPERLYEVQSRLAEISRMCRKYSCDFKELFSIKENANKELEILMQPDQAKDKLRKALHEAEEKFLTLTHKVTEERKNLSKELNKKVSKEMETLGFNSAIFEATLEPTEPTSSGAENIEFCVSLNPGAPGGPLRKIASGGELSRVALAIKKVLASCDSLPTLIFDEIDTGISGKTAEAVAESLNKLGKEKQVLLVTHLHQIAKEGSYHFTVSKTVEDNKTRVNINQVNGETRVFEIARMLGRTDETGLSFARTLLNNEAS